MHLIHKNTVEIDCISKHLGFEIQSKCSAIISEQLYPAIDHLLQQYDFENEIWTIAQLNINIYCTPNNWETEIVNQTLHQIEAYLKDNRKKENSGNKLINEIVYHKAVSTNDYCLQLFLQYLKTGNISSNTISYSISDIFKNIHWELQSINQLLKTISLDHKSFIRFILLSNTLDINKILTLIEHKSVINWNDNYFLNAQKYFNSIQLQAFSFLQKVVHWLCILKDNVSIPFIINLNETISGLYSNSVLSNTWPQLYNIIYTQYSDVYKLNAKFIDAIKFNVDDVPNNIQTNSENTDDTTISTSDNVKDVLFIDNAGIVILHPFLNTLFTNLGYCNNVVWQDIESQHKAVLALHYLCTGITAHTNAELYFNKRFCGMHADAIINTDLELSQYELQTCDELLLAVINHWNKLGNTSIHGLRTSFLKRKAKLEEAKDTIHLWIEKEGIDTLLDYLPWGIQIIKSPWLEKLIHCYWNY